MSTSSSSPDRPGPSARGRKGRLGSTRGRGRGGARTRSARTERADIALNIVQTRKERMKVRTVALQQKQSGS